MLVPFMLFISLFIRNLLHFRKGTTNVKSSKYNQFSSLISIWNIFPEGISAFLALISFLCWFSSNKREHFFSSHLWHRMPSLNVCIFKCQLVSIGAKIQHSAANSKGDRNCTLTEFLLILNNAPFSCAVNAMSCT